MPPKCLLIIIKDFPHRQIISHTIYTDSEMSLKELCDKIKVPMNWNWVSFCLLAIKISFIVDNNNFLIKIIGPHL